MSIHDEIAADAEEILLEFGKPILLEGMPLRALISEPQETLELGVGGFTASGNFTVKLLRHQLSQVPKIGAKLIYADQSYRIIRVSDRPPHALVTLTVEPLE
jgi:hypothetical protein